MNVAEYYLLLRRRFLVSRNVVSVVELVKTLVEEFEEDLYTESVIEQFEQSEYTDTLIENFES